MRCARCGRRTEEGSAIVIEGVVFGPECVKYVWASVGESDAQYLVRRAEEGR